MTRASVVPATLPLSAADGGACAWPHDSLSAPSLISAMALQQTRRRQRRRSAADIVAAAASNDPRRLASRPMMPLESLRLVNIAPDIAGAT